MYLNYHKKIDLKSFDEQHALLYLILNTNSNILVLNLTFSNRESCRISMRCFDHFNLSATKKDEIINQAKTNTKLPTVIPDVDQVQKWYKEMDQKVKSSFGNALEDKSLVDFIIGAKSMLYKIRSNFS